MGHTAKIATEVFAKDPEKAEPKGLQRLVGKLNDSALRCQEADDSSRFSRALRERIGDVSGASKRTRNI
jgi:hypothetical protein